MRVLICVLNWGLGHATRSCPIIEAMISRGHEVHLASDGLAKEVLHEAFPQLPLHSLAPLHMEYGKAFWPKLMMQFIPFNFWAVRDKIILREINNQHHFDLIISDSRPACRLQQVYSVFITNQPSPIFPYTWFERWFHFGMRVLMKSYNEIWIPDLPSDPSLSGKLIKMPRGIRTKYVGFLSRMKPDLISDKKNKKVDILAIVSGPEPLRTQLVNQLKSKLQNEDLIIIGGRPDHATEQDKQYKAYLSSNQIAPYLNHCRIIISRGGYSSLMDFAAFNKRLILIPTPGQTEQNYLAHRLASWNKALIWDTEHESWAIIKQKVQNIIPFSMQNDPALLPSALDEVEKALKKN